MPGRLKWLLVVLAIAAIAIGPSLARGRKATAVARAATALHSVVGEIHFEQTPFERAVAELGRRTGLRLAPRSDLLRQAGVDPDTPITLQIPRGSARAALGDLLDCAAQGRTELEFFIDESGAVVITTGDDYRRRAIVSRSYDIGALLPAGGDRRAAQGVIADFVRRRIDPRPPAATIGDISVEALADRLVVVADRETQSRVEPFLRGQTASQVRTTARLAGLTLAGSRSWSDQPLSSMFEQLSHEFGVRIVPAWPALSDAGIDPDTPITMRIRNIRAGRLLSICVDSSQLRSVPAGWSVDAGGTVIVTTRRQIDRGEYTLRIYDLYPIVRQWPAEPWKRRELTRAVAVLFENTVAPESWQPRGGEAWVRAAGWRFYVRQTPDNHRQITALLDQLFKSHRLPRFRGPEPVPDDADFVPPVPGVE